MLWVFCLFDSFVSTILFECQMLMFMVWLCFSGVTPEKLQEGLNPRHCALSLVGEPIMYPEINALVDELHGRRISTFLVTNAQFPEKILMMKPITQVCGVCFVHFFQH